MHIGYFEYDQKTFFFGRASDGTVTSAFELEIDAQVELVSIESKIQNRIVDAKSVKPTLQAHPERSIHRIAYDYDLRDWVEGFVILSFNDPEAGLVYIIFQRFGMRYQARAVSLLEAINKITRSLSGPALK